MNNNFSKFYSSKNQKLTEDIFEKEKNNLTPEVGFNLVGIDYLP